MSESKESLSVFLHWFAWAISIVASLFFIFFLVTEGIPDVVKGKDPKLVPYLPFLVAAIIGCFLSLFKRKPGAITMIIAGLAIDVVLYLQGGRASFGIMVVYGLPYIFPGILLLVKK
jgi:hypothetical protein